LDSLIRGEVFVECGFSLAQLGDLLAIASEVLDELVMVLFGEAVGLAFGKVRRCGDESAIFFDFTGFELMVGFGVACISLVVLFGFGVLLDFSHLFVFPLLSDLREELLHVLFGCGCKIIPGKLVNILSWLEVRTGSEGFAFVGVVVLGVMD
jgi:hypothetical protein